VDEFYDAAVSGADPIAERPGFKAMLDRIVGNGVRIILVESPDQPNIERRGRSRSWLWQRSIVSSRPVCASAACWRMPVMG
jgi:hypothetical protein